MQLGEVWVEGGELLGELPHSDDEEKDIQGDDEAHGAKEAPDQAVLQGQPAALVARWKKKEKGKKKKLTSQKLITEVFEFLWRK